MKKKKDSANSDLTRIEDLSEFLHQKDSDLDSKFDTFSFEDSDKLTSTDLDSNVLDTDEEASIKQDSNEIDRSETFPDMPENSDEEISPETIFAFSTDSSDENITYDKTSFGENPFGSASTESSSLDELDDVSFEEINKDNPYETAKEDQDHFGEKLVVDNLEEELLDFSYEEPKVLEPEVYTNTSERFVDVIKFAENVTYGTTGKFGGNPPFTIIARNIKYLEDAENILNLLSEYKLVNDQNRKDIEKAMELGAFILPQISEYTAILMAHKLRRFDLDLQVGLSDEINPTKLEMDNPRGLIKKNHLKQNKSESLKLSDLNSSINDIIISTTSDLPGYLVESYLGVQTTFTIVEAAELEKLQFVARSLRDKVELIDYTDSEISTDQTFLDYQNSFELLYDDLTMQLKQKAFVQYANALLGLTFLLSPIQYERSSTQVNAYQITCSATLAIVSKDDQ